jgi:hypothetical protein
VSQLGIPATIVAFITLQQITNLSTLIVNSDNINSVASDDLELDAPAISSTAQAAYLKIKEIKINYAGVHRIKFLLYNNDGVSTVYGRIYKNGVAFGTERSTSNSVPVLFTEDLTFAKGDLIQMYIKAPGLNTCFVSVFAIYGTVALGSVKLDNATSGGSLGYVFDVSVGGG